MNNLYADFTSLYGTSYVDNELCEREKEKLKQAHSVHIERMEPRLFRDDEEEE